VATLDVYMLLVLINGLVICVVLDRLMVVILDVETLEFDNVGTVKREEIRADPVTSRFVDGLFVPIPMFLF